MNRSRPVIIVLGGPNGAGKTTISRHVLAETLGITEFVNADTIAAGLSGFDPERAAFAAGRVMVERLHQLAAAGDNFAFESTLASRSFAPWLARLAAAEWQVHVLYVWLRSPELAIRRVRARVRRGGHAVPDDVIRRRYARSAMNLFSLYLPVASTWRIYDNSGRDPKLVARGLAGDAPIILEPATLTALKEVADAQQDEPGPL